AFQQWKISLRIEKAGNFVFGAYWSPTQIRPLAVERLMNSQIGLRMRLGPASDLRQPRAWHQNACRRYPTVLQRFRYRAIHRVRHSKVIGMNNKQPSRRWISQLLWHGWPRLRGSLRLLRREWQR